MYGDFLKYYFRLQFSAFWSMHDKLRHERMLILRCILPPPQKNELAPEKKVNPPATT